MNGRQERLFGPKQPRRGRAERSIDALGRYLAEVDARTPVEDALLTLARQLGRTLDRLEHDPDSSAHTIGTVARVQLEAISTLRPAAAPTDDTIDQLLADLADDTTALRDTPPT